MKQACQIIKKVAETAAFALLICVPHSRAENVVDAAQWLQYIASEVRELKAEVTACRLELQEQAIPVIEREVLQLQRDQHQLQAEEAVLKRRTDQTDDRMAAPSADPDATQLEVAREAIVSGELQRLKNEQAALAQREAETSERLRAAREKFRFLSQEVGKMSAQSGRTHN